MSGYTERQKIGVTRDRASKFCEIRASKRKIREALSQNSLQEISQMYKEPAPIVKPIQFPTGSIFGRQAADALPHNLPADHCLVCGKGFGLLNKRVSCNVCKKNFCAKCLKRLSKTDLATLQQVDSEVVMCCPQCLVLIMSVENHSKATKKLNESIDTLLPPLYDQMRACKITIESLLPKYEYLVFSICDSENSSSNNAAAFQQIYEHVIQMQDDVAGFFHKLESLMRDLTALQTHSKSSEKIKQNTKLIFIEFLQTQFPKFKGLQKQILKIELNTATNVYFILARAAIDSRDNATFWSKYGQPFGDAIHVVKKDMQRAALQAGENWEKHKQTAEDLVCSWEPKDKKGHSILGLGVPASREFEGTLLRKNIEVLRGAVKQLDSKVGANCLHATKEATNNLAELLQNSYKQQLRV